MSDLEKITCLTNCLINVFFHIEKGWRKFRVVSLKKALVSRKISLFAADGERTMSYKKGDEN